MSVQSERQIYVGISWSENRGLFLFLNGKLIKHTNVKAPKTTVPIGATSPNIVFGRSLIGTGHGMFQLASFLTFTTFLSEKAMSQVYKHYWRIGKQLFCLLVTM